jgi:EAL domain-containing protein (putative c-di-GMP-specific phosphodiesterase class I)
MRTARSSVVMLRLPCAGGGALPHPRYPRIGCRWLSGCAARDPQTTDCPSVRCRVRAWTTFGRGATGAAQRVGAPGPNAKAWPVFQVVSALSATFRFLIRACCNGESLGAGLRPAGGMVSDRREEFDRILDGRLLTPVFQPVVDLSTDRPVGYEALIRGPHGSELESPGALFREAYLCGRSAELDWACRAAAFRVAMEEGLPREFTLFVNVEPVSLMTECPADLLETVELGTRNLTVVLELTERYLIDDPAGVLEAVRIARADGLGIAIDDLGAEPASLAMMPLVRPDVIKLDLSLVQEGPTLLVARTVNGVLAEIERTGATVVAEGIETDRHKATGLAMGAVLGQGWFYGRPAPLPSALPSVGEHKVAVQRSASTKKTPFEVVAGLRRPRPATRELLQSLSKHVEYWAADAAEPAVLVLCFDDKNRLTSRLANRLRTISASSVMVAAFGVDMDSEPAKGVRGQNLASDDPLANEWVVVAVGAHYGAALVAHRSRSTPEPGDPGWRDDGQASYDFAVTYDRDLVIAAAHSLVQRISATPKP